MHNFAVGSGPGLNYVTKVCWQLKDITKAITLFGETERVISHPEHGFIHIVTREFYQGVCGHFLYSVCDCGGRCEVCFGVPCKNCSVRCSVSGCLKLLCPHDVRVVNDHVMCPGCAFKNGLLSIGGGSVKSVTKR